MEGGQSTNIIIVLTKCDSNLKPHLAGCRGPITEPLETPKSAVKIEGFSLATNNHHLELISFNFVK